MSVKVPAGGTRGVPFPRFMTSLFNGFNVRMLRAGRMRVVRGMPTLLLETRGARSGRTRRATLGYMEQGPGSWVVIASLGGAARNPAWLHNLAKDPDATIELGDGRRIRVKAETLAGPELDAAWHRIAAEAPLYDQYRSKTDREISLVRLRERAGA